uniref:Band 7 domain-containing protein n=1 Tax=Parascaris equorum TaxID=6256 RepID=A0A914RSN0_PAREQ
MSTVRNGGFCYFRVVSYAVPPQEILSKDSVTVSVDAVVYFRTSDPIASVNNVDDAIYSTKLLAQTTLRNALGMKTLTEMLTEREAIAQLCETILDEGTEHWGVKVSCSFSSVIVLNFSARLRMTQHKIHQLSRGKCSLVSC